MLKFGNVSRIRDEENGVQENKSVDESGRAHWKSVNEFHVLH